MVGFQAIKKRIRTANPQGKTRPKIGRKRPTRNPDLLTLGALVNPHKRSTMSKKKGQPKPTKKNASAQKKRTTNPFKPVAKKQKKRTNNPNRANLTNKTVSLLRNGALALGGLVATRQLPQMALQANNTGWVGYLANVGVALASATIAETVLKGSGMPVLIGGGLYVVDRVLTEKFSSAGQILSLSGVGDAKVAVNGTRGLSGVRQGYFPLPVQYDASGQPIIPQAIIAAAQAGMVSQAALAASPAPGVRGARGNVAGINRTNGNRLLAA